MGFGGKLGGIIKDTIGSITHTITKDIFDDVLGIDRAEEKLTGKKKPKNNNSQFNSQFQTALAVDMNKRRETARASQINTTTDNNFNESNIGLNQSNQGLNQSNMGLNESNYNLKKKKQQQIIGQ